MEYNTSIATITTTLTPGELANRYAAQNVFTDYQDRKAPQTLRRQRADLKLFEEYLGLAGLPVNDLYANPTTWGGVTYGLVEGFVRWMLTQGYAIRSVNVRLSTVKFYCSLAVKAQVLSPETYALINLVHGYQYAEGVHLDKKRTRTRVGEKKAEPVLISKEQVAQLKTQPDTPQGRRDTLLICLLLDHGLRCGEVAALTVNDVDLVNGKVTFKREKVNLTQTHELTRDTLIAVQRYLEVCQPEQALLLGSRKSKDGTAIMQGSMSTRAITARMEELCQRIGIEGASAHDGRHAWVTSAIRGGTDLYALQQAGGWKSLAMPLRYAAPLEIANKGVKLG